MQKARTPLCKHVFYIPEMLNHLDFSILTVKGYHDNARSFAQHISIRQIL